MKVFLSKDLIDRLDLSDEELLTYISLRIMYNQKDGQYYVSPNILYFYCTHQTEVPRKMREWINQGIYELAERGLIKIIKEFGANNFILDLSKLYIENEDLKEKFIQVEDSEIISIMNNNILDNYKMLRYFIYLIGISFKKGDIEVANAPMDIISYYCGMSKKSIIKYNNRLEELKLIYIYKPRTLINVNGNISGVVNIYGRYKYKEELDKFGEENTKIYIQKYGNGVRKISNYGDLTIMSRKYMWFRRGKAYPIEEIECIYNAMLQVNADLAKKYKNKETYKKYKKDLSAFREYPFYREEILNDE